MSDTKPPRQGVDSKRLEAFSDGVMAVIITIMAFNLSSPSGASLHALSRELPNILFYLLSFVFIGIYWNNHHHLFRATERIDGLVMWANLLLLFWLSLIPEATKWVATYHGRHLPACVYGIVELGAALGYTVLVRGIIRANGPESPVATAVGSDLKGLLSIVMYAGGVGFAWLNPWVSYGLYVGVAAIWFVPDRRFEMPG